MPGLPLEVGNHLALLWGEGVAGQPDAGVAHGLKRLAEAGGGPLRRGGGVVQFMRQTCGELAERHQLVALSLNPGGLADAVGHEGNQTLAEQGHSLQHFREKASVEAARYGWEARLGLCRRNVSAASTGAGR